MQKTEIAKILFNSDIDSDVVLEILNSVQSKQTCNNSDQEFDEELPLSKVLQFNFNHGVEDMNEACGLNAISLSMFKSVFINFILTDYNTVSERVQFLLDGKYEYKKDIIGLVLTNGMISLLKKIDSSQAS
jgi:hypothetical protein